MRPRKGAYQENLGRLGAVFREAATAPEPPELIVAPETALTGYFLEGGVRDLAVTADQLFDDLTCQLDGEQRRRQRGAGASGATACTARPW